MVGVENYAVNVLYKLPVAGVECLETPQKFGVWFEGELLSARSETEELGLSLMEEARLLEEDAVSVWGRMMLITTKDFSNSAVERSVLEDMV